MSFLDRVYEAKQKYDELHDTLKDEVSAALKNSYSNSKKGLHYSNFTVNFNERILNVHNTTPGRVVLFQEAHDKLISLGFRGIQFHFDCHTGIPRTDKTGYDVIKPFQPGETQQVALRTEKQLTEYIFEKWNNTLKRLVD